MRTHDGEVIRDIDWLVGLLRNILVETNERDWEDMKMKDYYEKEIVSMIEELQDQRQDRVDTLKELGYGC